MHQRTALKFALGIALAIIVLLTVALVRVENQRYALLIGMCRTQLPHADYTCLRNVETRTSWIWHVYYALAE